MAIALVAPKVAANPPCPAPTVAVQFDEFENTTWVASGTDDAQLTAYFGIPAGSRADPLRIVAELADEDWVFATRIYFKVDDRVVKLDVPSGAWDRSVRVSSSIRERADTPVSPGLAKALSTAMSITLKFQGPHREKVLDVPFADVCAVRVAAAIWLRVRGSTGKRTLADVEKATRDLEAEASAARAAHDAEVRALALSAIAAIRATRDERSATADRAIAACATAHDVRECLVDAARAENDAWKSTIEACQKDPDTTSCGEFYLSDSRPRFREIVMRAWKVDTALVRRVCAEVTVLDSYEMCDKAPTK